VQWCSRREILTSLPTDIVLEILLGSSLLFVGIGRTGRSPFQVVVFQVLFSLLNPECNPPDMLWRSGIHMHRARTMSVGGMQYSLKPNWLRVNPYPCHYPSDGFPSRRHSLHHYRKDALPTAAKGMCSGLIKAFAEKYACHSDKQWYTITDRRTAGRATKPLNIPGRLTAQLIGRPMVALSKCKNESETIKVQVHTDDHKRKCTPAHANSYGSQINVMCV
jgi:hypothetical protein